MEASNPLLTILMFLGIIASLAAVTMAFGGIAVVTLVAATGKGWISSTRVVSAAKGNVASGMNAYWAGIGVGSGLFFGLVSWWLLSIFASAEPTLPRLLIAAAGGTFVGFSVAVASIHFGRKLLGKFPIPARNLQTVAAASH